MASMRQSISQVTGVHRSIDGSLELLGIEPLEEHARSLAALLTVAVKGRVRHQPHLERLDGHMQALRNVYVDLSEDVRLGERSSPAAEWLLDNFHTCLLYTSDAADD